MPACTAGVDLRPPRSRERVDRPFAAEEEEGDDHRDPEYDAARPIPIAQSMRRCDARSGLAPLCRMER